MLRFRVTFRGDAEIAKKHWIGILQRAIEHAIEVWHQFMLYRHFTHAGATEYGYAPRKPVRRGKRLIPADVYKARRKGHSYPLVWTGAMKWQVMSRIDIRATAGKPTVKGRMTGPDYLRPAGRPALLAGFKASTARARGLTLPDMGGELTATTAAERDRLLVAVRTWVIDSLKALGNEERIVVVA